MDDSISKRVLGIFQTPYVYLLILALMITGVYIVDASLQITNETTRTWIARLATVSIGSYLTAVLVDLAFRRKEERDRERVNRIALDRLSKTINGHLTLLGNWYIGSIEEQPEEIPENYTDFFDAEYIEAVLYLDFSKDFPTGGPDQDPTWLAYTRSRMKPFSENIKEIIFRYGFYMEPEMIQTLEDVGGSEIVSIFSEIEDIVQLDRRMEVERDYNLLAGKNMPYYLAEHLDLLLTIIRWYEEDPELHLIPIQELDAWRDDTSPHPESARLEKPLEESNPKFGAGPTNQRPEFVG